MLVHLDLFSGIGGFALACEWAGIETIGFVEIDKYCQKVLRKHFPNVPIVEDIRDVKKIKEIVTNATGKGLSNRRGASLANAGEEKPESKRCDSTRSRLQGKEIVANAEGVRWTNHRELGDLGEKAKEKSRTGNKPTSPLGNSDSAGRGNSGAIIESPTILITGGFPCQPFSVAGKRRGTADNRYLWNEMFAVIKAVKPAWVLAENVAGIAGMEFTDSVSDLESEAPEEVEAELSAVLDRVCSDLEEVGYEVQPIIIPACAVNAPHRRDRVWIVANSKGARWPSWASKGQLGRCSEDMAISKSRESLQQTEQKGWEDTGRGSQEVPIADTKCRGYRRGMPVEQDRKDQQGQLYTPQKEQETYDIRGKIKGCNSISGETIRSFCAEQWAVEPELGRVAHGIPARVDRLKCLGNAIVPQVAYEIIKVIAENEDNSLPN